MHIIIAHIFAAVRLALTFFEHPAADITFHTSSAFATFSRVAVNISSSSLPDSKLPRAFPPTIAALCSVAMRTLPATDSPLRESSAPHNRLAVLNPSHSVITKATYSQHPFTNPVRLYRIGPRRSSRMLVLTDCWSQPWIGTLL